MECRDVDKLMNAWLDRELSPTQAGEIEAHLRGCQRCGREWGGLATLLNDPEPVEVPAGLRDRIMASLDGARTVTGFTAAGSDKAEIARADSRPSMASRWLRVRYAASAIAACFLFFLTGWFMSGWWMGSKPAVEVVTVLPVPEQVTVMVSPWVFSSMAQAAAMPAPVSPAVMLAGGVLPELVIPETRADEPMDRLYQRPARHSATRPANPAPDTDLKLLPLVPRYLGA